MAGHQDMSLGTIETQTTAEMTEIVFNLVKFGATFEVKPSRKAIDYPTSGYEGQWVITLTGGY